VQLILKTNRLVSNPGNSLTLTQISLTFLQYFMKLGFLQLSVNKYTDMHHFSGYFPIKTCVSQVPPDFRSPFVSNLCILSGQDAQTFHILLDTYNNVTKCCLQICYALSIHTGESVHLFYKYNLDVSFCSSGAVAAAVFDDFCSVVFSL